MAGEGNQDPRAEAVDRVVSAWRQGDCVLGEHWFAHRVDTAFSTTEVGRAASGGEADLVEDRVAGLIVVTQTCDVVRTCKERPYLEVCPVVEVNAEALREIERTRRPAFGYIPSLAHQRLVADLDRVMTVEKPVVVGWTRVPGWTTDDEARRFAQALARKRVRPAFPDDFVALVSKLQKRILDKHDRKSPEGAALRSLREIRVSASPHWDAVACHVMFLFIRDTNWPDFEGAPWDAHLESWLALVPEAGRFVRVEGLVTTLEDVTAAEYLASDALDLDHLSSGHHSPPPAHP